LKKKIKKAFLLKIISFHQPQELRLVRISPTFFADLEKLDLEYPKFSLERYSSGPVENFSPFFS